MINFHELHEEVETGIAAAGVRATTLIIAMTAVKALERIADALEQANFREQERNQYRRFNDLPL